MVLQNLGITTPLVRKCFSVKWIIKFLYFFIIFLAFQEVSKVERDSTYYRIARDFYPIKVSDTGKYGCFHNKSNGHSFFIASEEMIIKVAGNSIFQSWVRKLRIKFHFR
jgi:hypothetical protein